MNPYLAAECLYILQAKKQMSASTSLVIDFSGRLHGCVTYLNFALLLLSHAADTSRNELLEDAKRQSQVRARLMHGGPYVNPRMY